MSPSVTVVIELPTHKQPTDAQLCAAVQFGLSPCHRRHVTQRRQLESLQVCVEGFPLLLHYFTSLWSVIHNKKWTSVISRLRNESVLSGGVSANIWKHQFQQIGRHAFNGESRETDLIITFQSFISLFQLHTKHCERIVKENEQCNDFAHKLRKLWGGSQSL